MKRFLQLTQEGVFGTFHSSSPVQIFPRLSSADSFRVMTTPEFWEIMSGSGFAVPALQGTETTGLAATLTVPLCYSQASFLLGAAFTRINSGQTSPWVTTEIAGDLASFTADYGWTNVDGTIRRKRFLGCKIVTTELSGSRDSQLVMATFGIIGSTPQGNSFDASSDPDGTALPEPADSVFPTDPVLFEHARSGLHINNVARSNFQSLSFSVQSKCKAYFDESRFANLIRMNGRTTTLSGNSRLKASPDDRATYEAATNLIDANTLVFTNGTHTITLDLQGKNFFTSIGESFPLDEEIYFGWSIKNQLDTSETGNNPDFTLTYA